MIAAAKAGHYAVGYELNTWLVLYSKLRAMLSGVYANTEFHKKDLWKVKINSYKLLLCKTSSSLSPSRSRQVDLSQYKTIIFFGVESMVSVVVSRLLPTCFILRRLMKL